MVCQTITSAAIAVVVLGLDLGKEDSGRAASRAGSERTEKDMLCSSIKGPGSREKEWK